MATYYSGNLSTSNQYVKYRIKLVTGTQNITSNYTPCTVSIEAWRTNTGYTTYGTGTAYCRIDGKDYSASITTSQKITYNSYTQLFIKTVNITHGSDGSKRLSMAGHISIPGVALSSSSQSWSQALDIIPRKSELISAGITELQVSSFANLTINSDVKYAGFYHRAWIYDGSTWVWNSIVYSTSPNGVWTVPADYVNKMLNRMSNVTTKTFIVWLSTYSDGAGANLIGDSQINLTVNIHSNVVPSITLRSVSEYVSGLNAQFGAYVQNRSRLSLSMNATAGYGASTDRYKITANGSSYNSSSATTSALTTAGTNTITFEVIDTRGRKATATNNINVVAYALPRINSLTAERSNSDGTLNDQGTHALVKYNMSISPVSDGTKNRNAKTFTLWYRQSGGTWQEIALDSTNYSYNTSRVIGPLNVDSSYDVWVEAGDYFTNTSLTAIIPSTFTLINFASSKRGMSVGQAYDDALGGLMQVGGLDLNGSMIIDSGSVADTGLYYRWGNGLQVCLFYGTYQKVLNGLWGNSMYGASLGRITFPKPFLEVPYITYGTYGGDSVFLTSYLAASTTQTPEYWAYVDHSSPTPKTIKLNGIAFGRWK